MIEQIAAMTRNVIREDGFDEYLPTLFLPTTREVVVLDAELDGFDHGPAVADWLESRLEADQDYLVAFRSDLSHFKVVQRVAGERIEQTFSVDEA